MQTDRKSVTITTAYLKPGCAAQELLEGAGFSVHFSPEVTRRKTGEAVHEHILASDALILGTEPLTARDLSAIDGLKIVARTGAGYDNVDVAHAELNGIVVCNTPGANRQSVVELALGLLLSLARDLPQNIANTKSATWNQGSGLELSGSVLGIMGLGDIGRAVARSAMALGMRVIGYDPGVDPEVLISEGIVPVTFENLLAEADFVSLHMALTETTRNVIDRTALRAMKESAFLVNTSRGGIVNEADLVAALTAGEIAGAALDVIDEEPVTPDNPLLGAPNLLLTAHIAGATVQARHRSAHLAAQQIIDFFEGKAPAHAVTTRGR